jgi:hypothetical protein
LGLPVTSVLVCISAVNVFQGYSVSKKLLDKLPNLVKIR